MVQIKRRSAPASKKPGSNPGSSQPISGQRFIDRLKAGDWVACDTETTGLNTFLEDVPFMVGLGLPDGSSELFEWPINPFDRTLVPLSKSDPISQEMADSLPVDLLVHWACFDQELEYLKSILENPHITKVFHNAKFDIQMLSNIGITVQGRVEDTSFASRVCSTQEVSFGLKTLASKYLGIPDDDEKQLQDAVEKLRRRATRLKWKTGESKFADYWIVPYANYLGISLERVDYCSDYCRRDCVRTAQLFEMYNAVLDSEPSFREAYERELELLKVVMKMEARGFAISRERTQKHYDYATNKAAHHLEELRKMTGDPHFNPGSTPQLSHYLYDTGPGCQGLTATKMAGTKNGKRIKPLAPGKEEKPSTDWRALRPYMENPLVRELFMWRSADKSIDTFYGKYLDIMRPDPWTPNAVEQDTYVIHCSLNQCGTVTGRFSSNNPNLQQVANPESSPRGTDVHAREPFRPRPGYNLYAIDYAQMELRVFADCAKVKGMLETIYAGQDLNNYNTNRAWGGKGNRYALEAMAHSLELGHDDPTRQEIQEVWDQLGWSAKKARNGFRSDEAMVVADQYLARFDYDIVKAEKSILKSQSRQRGKTVMFAKMYGGGASAVMDLLYCSQAEAAEFLRQFDKPFPEINSYMTWLSEQAKQAGCIYNKYGRKLEVDPRFAYRAVNYMVQGTCADLMKRSIQKVHDYLLDCGLDAHCLMTIHDELIIEVRKDHCFKWMLKNVCKLMSSTDGALTVPMKVEMKRMTRSWEEKEKDWKLD